MLQVIGVAGISYDLVLQVDQFPTTDSKALSQYIGQFPGGFIANATVAIAKLGISTGFVGWVGNDTTGRMLRDSFLDENIDVQGLRLVDGEDTPFTVIMLNSQGERIILIPHFPLYEQQFDTQQLDYMRTGTFIVTYPHNLMWCRTLRECVSTNQGYLVLDIEHSSHLSVDELREIIQMTSICFVSDAVISKLRVESIEQIDSEGWIIHTQGEKGAEGYSKATGLLYEPAQPVKAIDTTGAGDCFHAAIIASYIRNSDLQHALHFASVATSIKIQHIGARNGLPTHSQVEMLL